MRRLFPETRWSYRRRRLRARMMTGSEVFADGALAGRVVLVTGGGTGLGKAAAAELRRCGAEVVICGRRADVVAATAAELDLTAVAGDVRAAAP